jgi:hypothetical protein
MTRWLVYPYRFGSEGAIMLAEGLGGQRIRLENSRYEHRDGDVIINWGNGHCTDRFPDALNADVDVCINKKTFFERMQGHNIVPPFAFSHDEALRHLSFPIVCRTQLEGADGSGVASVGGALRAGARQRSAHP